MLENHHGTENETRKENQGQKGHGRVEGWKAAFWQQERPEGHIAKASSGNRPLGIWPIPPEEIEWTEETIATKGIFVGLAFGVVVWTLLGFLYWLFLW